MPAGFALSEQSIGELEQTLAAARRRDLVGVEKGLERFVAARTRAKTLSRAIGFRC